MRFVISVVGVFFVLHGLVHLLYVAQSHSLLELQPGMDWPAGSWALSKLLGDGTTRWLASILYALAAVGFLVAGAGLLARQSWWRPWSVGAAVWSTVAVLLCWNGKLQNLDDQGLLALLINAAILVAVLVLHWPPR